LLNYGTVRQKKREKKNENAGLKRNGGETRAMMEEKA